MEGFTASRGRTSGSRAARLRRNAKRLSDVIAGDPALVHDTVNDPYLPAAVLLKPNLEIHAEWDGYWYWGRPTLEELRQGFRDLSRELRSDWKGPAA